METQPTITESNIEPPQPQITITNVEHINDGIRWDGYKITMSDQTKNIVCKISNKAQCCETFGVYCNKSNITELIGQQYLSVSITYPIIEEKYDFSKLKIVLSMITNVETVEFELFNYHNGYYPHGYYIKTEFEEKNDSF